MLPAQLLILCVLTYALPSSRSTESFELISPAVKLEFQLMMASNKQLSGGSEQSSITPPPSTEPMPKFPPLAIYMAEIHRVCFSRDTKTTLSSKISDTRIQLSNPNRECLHALSAILEPYAPVVNIEFTDYNDFALLMVDVDPLIKLSLQFQDKPLNCKFIAEILSSGLNTVKMNLSGNQIGPDGAAVIAASIAENRTIKRLSLEDNLIGNEGAKAIAEALMTNKSLKKLFLSRNQISYEGMKAIAQTLPKSVLTTLQLQGNYIGNSAAIALADNLMGNESLVFLGLQATGILDRGVSALVSLLHTNKSIKTIDLRIMGEANLDSIPPINRFMKELIDEDEFASKIIMVN